jgi:hypothetical protein
MPCIHFIQHKVCSEGYHEPKHCRLTWGVLDKGCSEGYHEPKHSTLTWGVWGRGFSLINWRLSTHEWEGSLPFTKKRDIFIPIRCLPNTFGKITRECDFSHTKGCSCRMFETSFVINVQYVVPIVGYIILKLWLDIKLWYVLHLWKLILPFIALSHLHSSCLWMVHQWLILPRKTSRTN